MFGEALCFSAESLFLMRHFMTRRRDLRCEFSMEGGIHRGGSRESYRDAEA